VARPWRGWPHPDLGKATSLMTPKSRESLTSHLRKNPKEEEEEKEKEIKNSKKIQKNSKQI